MTSTSSYVSFQILQLVSSMEKPSKIPDRASPMKIDLSLLPDQEVSPASTEAEREPIQIKNLQQRVHQALKRRVRRLVLV